MTGSVALALAGGLPATAAAALLPAQQIDAKTGVAPIQVGASMGSDEAYAAFLQETGGDLRLYAAFAVGGVFAPPVAVDQGAAVVRGALAGSRGTAGAVVVFEEEVNGKGVLFGLRLVGGIPGQVERISPSETDVELVRGGNNLPFDRNHALVANEAGAAAVCYVDLTDPNNPKPLVAVLDAGSIDWQTHATPMGCLDPGIDSRGNVAVFGQDMASIVVTRIVAGQVDEDPTEDSAMDLWSLEVSPGGQAMAQGRDTTFHVNTYYKPDIAEDGDWQKTVNVDEGIIQDGANPEDPFAVLDSQGDGVLLFRDNKMDAEQGYYRAVVGGVIGDGGKLSESMSRQRSAVDENSHPIVAYTDEDSGQTVFRRFNAGAPGPAEPLGPELGPNFGPNIVGISANSAGDFLALVDEGDALQAVIGDYVAPTLLLRRSKGPRVGKRVRLRSGALDALGIGSVTWKLPRGVKGKRTRRGATIDVRFKRKGRYTVTATAADRAGNSTTQALRFRVRAAKRRRG